MLAFETISNLETIQVIFYCFVVGLGLGYAWRAFWFFAGG
jgi:hypothetical protein